MAKRQPDLSGSTTPSVVLRAFAPETEYCLSLDGALLLEALGCAFITGGRVGLRDIVLALLVMTDEDAVHEARRKGRMDALVRAFSAGRRPGDIFALADKIAAAIQAAVEPSADGGDTREKKSFAAPVGGSP